MALYLVPVPLDEAGWWTLPVGLWARVAPLRCFLVEEERSARRFLSALYRQQGQPIAWDELELVPLGKHAEAVRWQQQQQDWAAAGRDVGLLSEAGIPAVADPGHEAVLQAHALGIEVVPLSGPSALMMALSASGLGGQQFRFHGYLPIEAAARRKQLIETLAEAQRGITQLCIETPHRNAALLQALLDHLPQALRICRAAGLSGPNEAIYTATVAQWRRAGPGLPARLPAVYLWGR